MASKNFAFKVLETDKYARCGLIETHRGNIETPAFMPVGTQGTIKAVFTDDIIKITDHSIICQSVIKSHNPYWDHKSNCLPSWIGIEFMAQSIAIWSGYHYYISNQKIPMGLLLGTRNYNSFTHKFNLDETIIMQAELLIKNVGINKTRIGLLHALKHMGANIQLLNQTENIEPSADILVKSSNLKGIILNTNLVANMIDEMPVFFIAAALSDGITIVKDAKELRTKESDRLQAMADALSSFGIKHDLEDDGIKIYGLGSKGVLNSTNISSYGDHRIAMATAIASLRYLESGATIFSIM